jgi:hypothetical protein
MRKKKIAVYFVCVLFGALLMGYGGTASSAATLSNAPQTVPDGTISSNMTEIWSMKGLSVCAWFNGDEPGDSLGVNTDPSIIRVGKTDKGNDVFSFMHLPMQGTFLHSEIESARLYLNIVQGDTPSALRIGLLKDFWSKGITDLANAQKQIDPESTVKISVQKAEDGWVYMDITGYVKDWLSGNVQNNGLVLLGDTEGEQTTFASDWYEGSENPPYVEVTGSIGERDLSYGKFEYLRHTENESDDAKIAEDETTNCLSYALRDTNIIGGEELGLDYAVMTDLYKKSGEDAVADYCAQKVSDYVERNKDGLKISGFRQIENFDSPIDPEKEYRIAFRVGCELYEGEEVLNDTAGFNYHVWLQVNTGQWAQKVMFGPTAIVPGTPPGVSPGKYPWDSTLEWGEIKSHGFLTSKTIYFAVTKDVDGFTQHKGTLPAPV